MSCPAAPFGAAISQAARHGLRVLAALSPRRGQDGRLVPSREGGHLVRPASIFTPIGAGPLTQDGRRVPLVSPSTCGPSPKISGRSATAGSGITASPVAVPFALPSFGSTAGHLVSLLSEEGPTACQTLAREKVGPSKRNRSRPFAVLA